MFWWELDTVCKALSIVCSARYKYKYKYVYINHNFSWKEVVI